MFKLSKMKMRAGLGVLAILAIILVSSYVASPVLAATSPSLGAAGSYSVLAGSIVTNTGTTTMNGNLGVSPSIGVPPHVTGGPSVGGAIHDADTNAAAAQAANTATFGFINQPSDVTYTGVKDLTGLSLVAGVYSADAFTLTGTLTLAGSGVWIFKSASTLITSGTANVAGGSPCNVWWRVVSSATLGTNTQLTGNILALTSITLAHGATLNGRALAQTGAVTMDSNVINTSACGGGAANPHLSLTKSVTPATYNALNNTLTYTLIATNDGNTSLTNVLINDPGLNITNNGGQPTTLAPGDTLTVTGTRSITQADLDRGKLTNTATASATGAPVSAPISVTVFKQQSGPHLSLTKDVIPLVFSKVGDVLYYTLIATNDGNVTLTGVSISDLELTNILSTPLQPATLAPGETLKVTGTYTITQGDLDRGSFNNTATASGSSETSATASQVSLRETVPSPVPTSSILSMTLMIVVLAGLMAFFTLRRQRAHQRP